MAQLGEHRADTLGRSVRTSGCDTIHSASYSVQCWLVVQLRIVSEWPCQTQNPPLANVCCSKDIWRSVLHCLTIVQMFYIFLQKTNKLEKNMPDIAGGALQRVVIFGRLLYTYGHKLDSMGGRPCQLSHALNSTVSSNCISLPLISV